jgi:hypothetical protein
MRPGNRPPSRGQRLLPAGLFLVLVSAGLAMAQISVRPRDPSGLSIREPRVRVLHSETPEVPGTSLHLQQTDPWLTYQRGHSYFFHEWSKRDGVFAAVNARPLGATTTSCGMCHNMPFRSPGAGGNTSEPLGFGRNAPHLFGAGQLEMLGVQIRRKILNAHDANHNGYLDVPAETAGQRAVVEAAPGVKVDFGSLDDAQADGLPDLNPALKVFFVDREGKAVRRRADGRPARLGDPEVAGYDLAVGVFSSNSGDHQFPTLRSFVGGVLITIMGMAADDPTLFMGISKPEPWRSDLVWARTSNAGAPQANLELQAMAAQTIKRLTGAVSGTVSQGEVDLLEWFLLNHPAPAQGPQDEQTRQGRRLLDSLGCTSCHVASWTLEPEDKALGYAGDRRFFDLDVRFNPSAGRLEGKLRSLTREAEGPRGARLLVPRRGGFEIREVFTDLLHHDVGERFHEPIYVKGKTFTLKRFRTPPLWGVGSTAPYGHDGGSATLDDVIRRHGGEAAASTAAYLAAPAAEREAVIRYLQSLVLYQPDILPTDLDGDGKIANPYRVAGREVGPERFQPELLFRSAPSYRGWIRDPEGAEFFSYELVNQREAYGEDLEALVDRDGDGIPDLAAGPAEPAAAGAVDPAPRKP